MPYYTKRERERKREREKGECSLACPAKQRARGKKTVGVEWKGER